MIMQVQIMQSPNMISDKEKRMAYNYIKRLGIAEDGIIYGGLVRDEIIATYYKTKFDEYAKTFELGTNIYDRFWNNTFHPESANRLLVPNDMDIFFNSNEKADQFIAKLTDFAKEYSGNIISYNVQLTNGLFYVLGDTFVHKKIKVLCRIGKTFTYIGYRIELMLDVIINTQPEAMIEPPFNSADFTSNLFVMSKIQTGDYEIRLSRNTGTPLDLMPHVIKRRTEMQIIDDMIAGKTEFIRNSDSEYSEYINGMRILKMLNKSHYLKITNLLFNEVQVSEYAQNCDVCTDEISKNAVSDFIEIKTNRCAINVMHRKCFLKYLENEIMRKYRNPDTNRIECRCTRRNCFNFKDSYKFSTLYK